MKIFIKFNGDFIPNNIVVKYKQQILRNFIFQKNNSLKDNNLLIL